jgi:hypothetical protein
MEFASGHTTRPRSHEDISKHEWTAKDCQEVLRIIRDWSGGNFGDRMLDFALEDPDWLMDPIPDLKERMRR